MSATNRGGVRIVHDNYASPAWTVRRILQVLPQLPGGTWLEPMAGDGAIIRAVNCYKGGDIFWTANELREECVPALRRSGTKIISIGDYLDRKLVLGRPNVVISNPAFSVAQEAIERSKELCPKGWILMQLRLNFAGSEKRWDWLQKDMPDIYVLPNRPQYGRNKDGKKGSDSIEYAWFVWTPERRRAVASWELLPLTPLEERREDELVRRREVKEQARERFLYQRRAA